jgi:hypothetical protein
MLFHRLIVAVLTFGSAAKVFAAPITIALVERGDELGLPATLDAAARDLEAVKARMGKYTLALCTISL